MFLKSGSSLVVLAVVLGCAGGTKGPSTGVSPVAIPLTIEAVAGDYALVAVDGHLLPYTPRLQGGAAATPVQSVVSGSFQLKTNGTFRLQTVYSPDVVASGPGASGTCYAEGNEVRMIWDGGGLTNMTRRGDTVFLKREALLYAYLRTR